MATEEIEATNEVVGATRRVGGSQLRPVVTSCNRRLIRDKDVKTENGLRHGTSPWIERRREPRTEVMIGE